MNWQCLTSNTAQYEYEKNKKINPPLNKLHMRAPHINTKSPFNKCAMADTSQGRK